MYSLPLSDFDSDRAAAEERPLSWGMRVEEKCQPLPKHSFIGISELGDKYSSAAIGELYQQRLRELLIGQYISLWHWRLSSQCPSGSRIQNVFLEGWEGRNVMVSLTLTNEKQWRETKNKIAATDLLLVAKEIRHKTMWSHDFASSFTLYLHPVWCPRIADRITTLPCISQTTSLTFISTFYPLLDFTFT